jgi:HSP20 family protein
VEKRRDLERAAEEIEQLFADLWQVFPFSGLRRSFRLPVDCIRTEDAIVVVAEVAGIDPADVRVVVHGRTLLLTGKRDRPSANGQYQQMEIDYGPFQRHVTLSEEIDAEHASASYERGILTIRLPIAQRAPVERNVTIEVTRS